MLAAQPDFICASCAAIGLHHLVRALDVKLMGHGIWQVAKLGTQFSQSDSDVELFTGADESFVKAAARQYQLPRRGVVGAQRDVPGPLGTVSGKAPHPLLGGAP